MLLEALDTEQFRTDGFRVRLWRSPEQSHEGPEDRIVQCRLGIQRIPDPARQALVGPVARAGRAERGELVIGRLVAPPRLCIALLILLAIAATPREGHRG